MIVFSQLNHFPGTGFITQKVHLATSSIDFVPRAFKLPQQSEKFREWVRTKFEFSSEKKVEISASSGHTSPPLLQKLQNYTILRGFCTAYVFLRSTVSFFYPKFLQIGRIFVLTLFLPCPLCQCLLQFCFFLAFHTFFICTFSLGI